MDNELKTLQTFRMLIEKFNSTQSAISTLASSRFDLTRMLDCADDKKIKLVQSEIAKLDKLIINLHE